MTYVREGAVFDSNDNNIRRTKILEIEFVNLVLIYDKKIRLKTNIKYYVIQQIIHNMLHNKQIFARTNH